MFKYIPFILALAACVLTIAAMVRRAGAYRLLIAAALTTAVLGIYMLLILTRPVFIGFNEFLVYFDPVFVLLLFIVQFLVWMWKRARHRESASK